MVFSSASMVFISISAAFVGLVHTLAPGHWLPVVLMAKSKRWPLRTAFLGALITASGHIFFSILLGLLSIWVGVQFLSQFETEIERYAGLGLAVFGILYTAVTYLRHSKCHTHTSRIPSPRSKTPFLFLFSLGLSPCVAIIPVFAAAATEGSVSMVLSFLSFSTGVLLALIGATGMVFLGLLKLDHPIFERHGDTVTGLGVTLMGVILFFVSH